MPVIGFVPLRAPDRTYEKPVVRVPMLPKPTPFVPYRPGEPVPDPLPPADLGLGFGWVYPVVLLVGQLYALRARKWWDATKKEWAAQKWGTANNKRREVYGPPVPVPGEFLVTAPVVGTYSPTGQNRITRGSYSGYRWNKASAGAQCAATSNLQQFAPRTTTVGGIKELKILYGPQQECGTLNTGFYVYLTAGGWTLMEGLTAGSGDYAGWRSMIYDGWVVEALPGSSDVKDARSLMPWNGTVYPAQPPVLPEEAEVPEVKPPIRPPFAPPLPARVPGADPVTQPETEPAKPPLKPGTPVAPPAVKPEIPGSLPIRDGSVVAPAPAPIPVTPADVVFPIPGGSPVGGPGQSPRPDLVGVAQEVGRIERKLEGLLNPQSPEVNPVPEWLSDLAKVWEVLTALEGGGEYLLTEPCDPDGDGQYVQREVKYSGAIGMLGLLSNKIDALAELQQAAKDLRQPTCPRPRPTGQLVTARFRSTTPSPNSSRVLRKELRYRDNAGRPEADHVAHWLGFEWQAGPAIVHSKGASWGIVEVWAADPEEGRRVIRHAAAIAGVDLTAPGHAWVDATPRSTRYGQPGLMRVEHTQDGIPCISKRDGPSGTPSWMRDP